MGFPSHTMYSSLCHVPNRAQTGPKQLRKLTPLCHVTVARSLVVSARKRLSSTPKAVHSWLPGDQKHPKTPGKLDTNSIYNYCHGKEHHPFCKMFFRWITSIISPPESPHPTTNPAWVLPDPDPESQWGISRYLVFSQKLYIIFKFLSPLLDKVVPSSFKWFT